MLPVYSSETILNSMVYEFHHPKNVKSYTVPDVTDM